MRYTYEDIMEMRGLIAEEIAFELRVSGKSPNATAGWASSDNIESRLRTYMQAEVTAGDMQLAAKARVEPAASGAYQGANK